MSELAGEVIVPTAFDLGKLPPHLRVFVRVVDNEGKLVAVVPQADADRLLSCMRGHPLGAEAAGPLGARVDPAEDPEPLDLDAFGALFAPTESAQDEGLTSAPDAVPAQSGAESSPRVELVVVDPAIENHEAFVAALTASDDVRYVERVHQKLKP